MKSISRAIRLCNYVFMLFLVGVCNNASASFLTFYGADNGVSADGARPNSDAAFMAFQSAIGGANISSLITFEGAPAGTEIPSDSAYNLGLGVSVQSVGDNVSIISTTNSTLDGYNITAGGLKYLQLSPGRSDIDLVFSFPSPINSFGLFVTGSQMPGPDNCPSSCGSLQLWADNNLLAWPSENNVTGGVYFFGFIDTKTTYSKITLSEHGPFCFDDFGGYSCTDPNHAGSPDLMGVDNIIIAHIPEPSSLMLLGLGLAGFGLSVAVRANKSRY